MAYRLNSIPTGVSQLDNTTSNELSQIYNELVSKTSVMPKSSELVPEHSCALPFSAFKLLQIFTEFDKIMYNIGIDSKPRETSYFHLLNTDLRNRDITQEYYTSSIANVRILVDKHLKNNELNYDANAVTELRAASLHLQETNRHIVRVFKFETTLLVVTNKVTWELLIKTKALSYVLFKDQYFTYNTDIVNACQCLATKDLEGFNKYLEKILNYKTWLKYRRATLANCFKLKKEQQLKRKRESIDDTDAEAANIQQNYHKILMKLKRLQEEYQQLLESDETVNTDEILDYLDAHKYITNISKYSGTRLQLSIKAPILYFDQDYVESYRNFRNDEIKEVMHKVFVEQKYRLWTDADVVLDTNNFNAMPLRRDFEDCRYLPHPHLSVYTCTGNHTDQIRKWITNYDYIGCIEQIMVMVYNLNWTDGIVISNMLQTIQRHPNKKIFEVVGTGEFVSFNDILNTKEEE